MDQIVFIALAVLLLWQLSKPFITRNRTLLYTPIFFLSLFFSYYTIIPYLTDKTVIGELDFSGGIHLYLLACLVNYAAILIGFYSSVKVSSFSKFNNYISVNNAKEIGLILMFIAISVYGVFRNWNFSLFFTSEQEDSFVLEERMNHTEYYLTELSKLFIVASSCLYVANRRSMTIWLWVCLFFEFLIALMGGFRATVAIFLISYAIFYQNYPTTKKMNYIIWIPVGILFFLSLGAMERSRTYGYGYNIDTINEMVESDTYTESAAENYSIYRDGALTMKEFYESGKRYYFEPIICAILQPLPRAYFPWKPNADYLRDASKRVYKNFGASVVNSPVEAYISFGWLGVFFYGLLIGFLCKKFWFNYIENKDKIGALILLASFNSFLFIYVSRGYLAQVFVSFMYVVIIPFIVIGILLKIVPSLTK